MNILIECNDYKAAQGLAAVINMNTKHEASVQIGGGREGYYVSVEVYSNGRKIAK